MIGFLSVLIVLIVWTVSAVLCFGLLEGFSCSCTSRFGCICGILFDCFWFPWEPIWGVFWVSGAPLESFGDHFGVFVGSQGVLGGPF